MRKRELEGRHLFPFNGQVGRVILIAALAATGAECAAPADVQTPTPTSLPTATLIPIEKIPEVLPHLHQPGEFWVPTPTLEFYLFNDNVDRRDLGDIFLRIDEDLLRPATFCPFGELLNLGETGPFLEDFYLHRTTQGDGYLEVGFDPQDGSRWTELYVSDHDLNPAVPMINAGLIHRLGMMAGSQVIQGSFLEELVITDISGERSFQPIGTTGFTLISRPLERNNGSRVWHQAVFLHFDLLARLKMSRDIYGATEGRGFAWAGALGDTLVFTEEVDRVERRLQQTGVSSGDFCFMYSQGDLRGLLKRISYPDDSELDVLNWIASFGQLPEYEFKLGDFSSTG